jgi:hypothetical protein
MAAEFTEVFWGNRLHQMALKNLCFEMSWNVGFYSHLIWLIVQEVFIAFSCYFLLCVSSQKSLSIMFWWSKVCISIIVHPHLKLDLTFNIEHLQFMYVTHYYPVWQLKVNKHYSTTCMNATSDESIMICCRIKHKLS